MKFNLNIDEIKYAKILCKDILDNPFSLRGAIKSINDREILFCSKFEQIPKLTTPQEVTLSIIYSDGLYRTKTILKSLYQEEPYIFCPLEAPQGLEYQQNREYFRIASSFNAKYYVKSQDKFIDFDVKTCDISANGVSILLGMHIISEEDSRLVIYINDRKIETRIRYIRSEKVEDGYRISFAFEKMDEADRDFISQVCIKQQLDERRKHF